MHTKLLEVFRLAGHSLFHSECFVSNTEMQAVEAEAITARVRSQLVQQLCAFAVDSQILNNPDCLSMEDDLFRDATRYRARIHLIPPNELRVMLERAFEAGRAHGVRMGDYTPYPRAGV